MKAELKVRKKLPKGTNLPNQEVTVSSEPKLTWWERLKFFLFIKSLGYRLAWHDYKQAEIRKKYCRRGYHRLTRAVLSHHSSKGKTVKIEYLQCHHCNWRFFANIKEKQKYMNLKKKESGVWKTLYHSD